MKTLAIDLDDTLNDFTATLRTSPFDYDEAFAVSRADFDGYLARVRRGETEPGTLLATEYSFFRARIHVEVYRRANPRPDGVAFVRAMRAEGWRIVVCTRRDLRRAYRQTKAWLDEHGIPFDHLFMAGNKIAFCKLWGIDVLVDDDLFNIEYGARHGVRVYFPLNDTNRAATGHGARGFESFDEVRAWITASS